jgi:hypothetical protein
MRGEGGKPWQSHALEAPTEKGDEMRIAYVDTIRKIADVIIKETKDSPDLSPAGKDAVIGVIEMFYKTILNTSVDAQELANQIAQKMITK